MKLGICGYLTGRNAVGREFDLLAAAKQVGFDYIELPLSTLSGLSDKEYTHLRAALDAGGLPCEACNVFFPGSLRLTGPEVDAQKIHAYLELALKRAAMIGVKVIVFGSSGARSVPDAFPKERAWVQLVEMLRIAGPIAASHGIFIAIEPLRSEECNLINTAAEGFSLARLVDHPNVGLLMDIYHMVQEGEDFGIASTARRFLGHAHFAEPQQRDFPLAVDSTTRAFIDALRRADYQGRLSLEANYSNFQREAPQALEVMRTLSGTAQDNARKR